MRHGLKQVGVIVAMTFAASMAMAGGQEAPKEVPKVTDSIVVTADTGDQLIYSVDRIPERPFDTSRADTVITGTEIRQANKAGLAELLEEQAGIVVSSRPSGGTPIVRGLSDKQVMILVDGIKVNNATWGGTDIVEYLNLIAIEQIERIEIVRGVVSVLGTESLGGVINIITKKGPPAGQTFGGSIAARYGSGDSSFKTPLELYGHTNNYRFDAGLSAGSYGDVKGVGDVGKQPSGFHQRDGYANGQLLLTHDKTLSFGYQNVRQNDVQWPAAPGLIAARDLILSNLAYQDLTSRSWEDSFRITGFINRQLHTATLSFGGPAPFNYYDNDALMGTNIEVGKFIGSHHFLYGIDYTADKIRSWSMGPDFVTGVVTLQRGTEMDRARYSAMAGYLQDRFDPAKWLTVIAGARYGRFSTSGHETTILGPTSLDGHHGDVTGAINLIGHVTPTINVIGNVFRGFRAPNLDDVSRSGFKSDAGSFGFEITNPDAQSEHVMSYEAGLKFDDGRVQAAAYAYRNQLTNLLAVTNIGYVDFNQNGIKDGFDFDLLQNRNVGKAQLSGYEVEGRWMLPINSAVWAHYASTKGTNTATGEPLSSIPGGYGALGYRYAPPVAHTPWAEVVWRHQATQDRLSAADRATPLFANGIQGFDLVNVRGGISVTHDLSITLSLENLFNEKYREIGAPLEGSARQAVLTTRYAF
ncbi:MAG TPA: TonB-dependent receptor [Thermoanaerobaculia bacterium]